MTKGPAQCKPTSDRQSVRGVRPEGEGEARGLAGNEGEARPSAICCAAGGPQFHADTGPVKGQVLT